MNFGHIKEEKYKIKSALNKERSIRAARLIPSVKR
jgi:hypothetical protein